jgi:7,8-dihydropterin-6-yl-methyl-4-(beta-D-ribofuranosyl)aminobenzene 5'-phosphate synthase
MSCKLTILVDNTVKKGSDLTSHQGILNITATVKKRTGLPVRRIIGGIHLNGEGQERMDRTLNELKRLGVRDFNLCHCSGVNVLGRVSAGTVIKLD